MTDETIGSRTEGPVGNKKGSPVRPLLVLLGIVVVAIMLYAFGVRQGRGQLDAQRLEFEERLATAARALTTTEERLAVVLNVKNLQEAEVALLQSAVELDRRNFGTANEHLREAGTVLGRIQDPAGGVSLEQIQLLVEDVGRLDINVAVNLEDQRSRVLGLAGRLRDLIPELPQEPVGIPAGEGESPVESPAAE